MNLNPKGMEKGFPLNPGQRAKTLRGPACADALGLLSPSHSGLAGTLARPVKEFLINTEVDRKIEKILRDLRKI
jgi:hypothetical protein